MQSFRFDLFGFKVEVLPTFLLVVAIALLFELQAGGGAFGAFLWGAVVFVSILVHELGHAFVARGYGLRVGTIQLHALGGQVAHERTKPSRQLAISLAGPGAGLALGALTYAAWYALPEEPTVQRVVYDLLFVNIGWSLFNLLPLYPLDGGTALRSGLALWWGERRAVRSTAALGVALGIGIAILGFQAGMMFVPLIGGMAAYTNWQVLQST